MPMDYAQAHSIVTQLERIADALEPKKPTTGGQVQMREEDAHLVPAGSKLSTALADVIVHELQLRGEADTGLHPIIEKYADRYFANHQDTSDKLAQAFGELHALRARAHKERIAGMDAVIKLIAYYKEPEELLRAANNLREINEPRAE